MGRAMIRGLVNVVVPVLVFELARQDYKNEYFIEK